MGVYRRWGADRADGHTIRTGKSEERLCCVDPWLAYVSRDGPGLSRDSTQRLLGYHRTNLHRNQQCCRKRGGGHEERGSRAHCQGQRAPAPSAARGTSPESKDA